ncbi:hypothetical protein [Agaribacterium sp. ZY112]|uniref:hypothetical protein n=1 Tax=Agaribacterium sp. ZY112 TaxID=3233574 RepID=UPI003523C8E4
MNIICKVGSVMMMSVLSVSALAATETFTNPTVWAIDSSNNNTVIAGLFPQTDIVHKFCRDEGYNKATFTGMQTKFSDKAGFGNVATQVIRNEFYSTRITHGMPYSFPVVTKIKCID